MARKTPRKTSRPAARRTPRRAEPTDTDKAQAAGEQYAQDQINGEYFMNWTKSDARKIAHNMLQQLEWDTKRDLDGHEIARLSGVDYAERDIVKAFYEGFDLATTASLGWLADELLEMNNSLNARRR